MYGTLHRKQSALRRGQKSCVFFVFFKSAIDLTSPARTEKKDPKTVGAVTSVAMDVMDGSVIYFTLMKLIHKEL